MRRLLLALTGFAIGVAIAVVLSAQQHLTDERAAMPDPSGVAGGSGGAHD